MFKNVVISNPLNFKKIKEKFKKDGAKKLHILSDFERTLTYAFVKEEKVPSLISVLRSNKKYLGQDYAQKAQALFEKYRPIEIDPKIPLKEKKKKMEEWWMTHFKLLIEKGLSKKHLKKVIESGKIKLRK
jgi:5'-nucleotidase